MAVNYTIKYADKIAERFHKASITDAAAGHEYSFVGAKTIRVYSVDTVPETDYNRTADGNRFGTPKNLGDTVQEMTMNKAPAFTFVIEPLDNSDQAIEKSAGKSLRRQLDEVTIPNMDKYRLRKWCEGANIQYQPSAAPTKSTIVEYIIDVNAQMTDAFVPVENRTLYIPTEYYKLLKQNPDFINLEGLGTKALAKGVVGEVDGCKVVTIPKSYLPAGVYFLIKYKGSSVDPVKLQDVKIHQDPPGISGNLIEGRHYYDAFVLGAKCKGVVACVLASEKQAAPTLTISTHSVTPTSASAAEIRYTLDGSDPRYSESAKVVSGAVTTEEGQTIRAVAFGADGKFTSDVAEATDDGE